MLNENRFLGTFRGHNTPTKKQKKNTRIVYAEYNFYKLSPVPQTRPQIEVSVEVLSLAIVGLQHLLHAF